MTVGAGHITDLTPNDHACLTFGEPEELFDLTAAFVRDGLSGGLKVVWLSAAELSRRGVAAAPAVAAGQLAPESDGRLLSGTAFSATHATGWLSEQIAACRQEGFPGLRVAVDMSWALRPIAGVEQLPDFEKGIAEAMADTSVSVLCQYDRPGAGSRPGRRRRGLCSPGPRAVEYRSRPRAVTGPLDLGSAGQLTAAVDDLTAGEEALGLVLDLSGLTGWDSSGLAALITIQQRVTAQAGARLIVAGLPGHLEQRRRDAALPRRFALAENVDDALGMLTSPP